MTQEKRARERSKVSAKETQLRLAGTSYNKEFSIIIRKAPMESIIKPYKEEPVTDLENIVV